MPEQFGFEQVLRNRGAVHGNELAAAPAALPVQVTGDQFLAGPRFAGDQDARVAGRDLIGQPDDIGHRRIAEHDRIAFLGHRLEHGSDQLGIRRQRDELLRARLDGAHRFIGIVADAARHHRNADSLVRQILYQAPDIQLGIGHDHVGTMTRTQRFKCTVDVIDMGHGGTA